MRAQWVLGFIAGALFVAVLLSGATALEASFSFGPMFRRGPNWLAFPPRDLIKIKPECFDEAQELEEAKVVPVPHPPARRVARCGLVREVSRRSILNALRARKPAPQYGWRQEEPPKNLGLSSGVVARIIQDTPARQVRIRDLIQALRRTATSRREGEAHDREES